MTNTRTTLLTTVPSSQDFDYGKFESCELNIDTTLIYLHLHPLMYHMCRNLHRKASLACRNMYLWYILPAASSINERDLPLQEKAHRQCGGLLHHSSSSGWKPDTCFVSLVSSYMETVSKTCLFKIGQYHLALLNSSCEEAYEHLFRGLLVI